MNDRTIRVMAAAVALGRFTVAEVCEASGLRRSQVDPILNLLKKEAFLIPYQVPVAAGPSNPVAHRPPGVYEVTSDPDKRQELANRLYGTRRAIERGERDKNALAEIKTVDIELDCVELLLRICDRATKLEPLGREDLQAVEKRLVESYNHLLSATYEAGIDVRKLESRQHPLSVRWDRWRDCSAKLDVTIDRWEKPRAVSPKVIARSGWAATFSHIDVAALPRDVSLTLGSHRPAAA